MKAMKMVAMAMLVLLSLILTECAATECAAPVSPLGFPKSETASLLNSNNHGDGLSQDYTDSMGTISDEDRSQDYTDSMDILSEPLPVVGAASTAVPSSFLSLLFWVIWFKSLYKACCIIFSHWNRPPPAYYAVAEEHVHYAWEFIWEALDTKSLLVLASVNKAMYRDISERFDWRKRTIQDFHLDALPQEIEIEASRMGWCRMYDSLTNSEYSRARGYPAAPSVRLPVLMVHQKFLRIFHDSLLFGSFTFEDVRVGPWVVSVHRVFHDCEDGGCSQRVTVIELRHSLLMPRDAESAPLRDVSCHENLNWRAESLACCIRTSPHGPAADGDPVTAGQHYQYRVAEGGLDVIQRVRPNLAYTCTLGVKRVDGLVVSIILRYMVANQYSH